MRIAIIASVLFLATVAQARDSMPVCAQARAGHARCEAQVALDENGIVLANPRAPVGGYAPADLRGAYKITGLGSSPTIVAAVAAYGYDNAEADLAVYRTQFGLPACTTANGCFKKLNQRGKQGGYPAQNVGWAQESALDLDMASAICPRCKIWLVEADSSTIANLAATEDMAAKLGAHAISNSYGAPDSADTLAHEGSYNHPGIAITASVGDSGFGGGAQFPASSPHVTAVGGTHLARDSSARGWSETAWSTGGCTSYAKPAWQTDTGCGAHRTVADVAAVADPNTGVAVYGPVSGSASGWMVFGGTSVPAPIIAGVYGVNGGTVSYGSNPYAHPGALFDITSGGGGSCMPSYLCIAGPGYDGPTGMGTPNGVFAFGEP